MVSANLLMLKARHMKGNGPTICDMEQGSCATSMESNTMAVGSRMDEKVLVVRSWDRRNLSKETTLKVKKMALGSTNGRMVPPMKEIGKITKSMALEFTSGLMAASLLANGSTAKQVASASTAGRMVEDTRASFRRISDRGTES